MKSNIEIKARAASLKELKQKVQEICTADPVILNQKDIYYLSRIGRLKLRIFSDNEGELISYKRDNIRGPKKSEYWIYKTSEPIQLYNTLSDTLDVIGVVEKKRLVYITGQTRIHLDE
ncbi:MAG: CYTH domain-containing protein, partial [Candidatus Dadabacteria bacterium]|nr:CYTH domain-containing protein [Candidatus Dadabacteria bacterium]